MIIDGQKVYLFNPWQIKRWKDEEISMQVNELIKLYDPEDDTMYGISKNIEIISDILYLYGEMIARLTEQTATIKLRTDTTEAKETVRTRKDWIIENPGEKAPAISYFEAKAKEIVQDDRDKQNDLNSNLIRFKFAYESMEAKMNALKRKQDSIKYEEFSR